MRYWIVFSTARMFTRPVHHKYLFSRSPWRFSSAVHARVQRAQAVWSEPVWSSMPSMVFSIVWYVGRASSVIRSPISETMTPSGMSRFISLIAATFSDRKSVV